ncbi:MAG: hypothetical protein QG552_3181 [Thermodesulfobacteriota bacterium]|nr:hypothetical protein [Thermodesulfobacteriota bacterium]
MDLNLLREHIKNYIKKIEEDHEKYFQDMTERKERKLFYQSWTKERILRMSEEDLYNYLAKLWAMLIWGNKQYVVDKLLQEHGLDIVRKELAQVVWGDARVMERWDRFRSNIKGMGPAMMSEILCHVHPKTCMLWNRRAYVGLNYLGIKGLPKYNYQMTGQKYRELSNLVQKIADELKKHGIEDPDLLSVDYFIWDELQVEDNLSQIHKKLDYHDKKADIESAEKDTSEFIHNEIRDKLADIGEWLGFSSKIEIKVSEGSKVDAIWEATIGNMGRVIYVFEVQTKGSIDSLIINLLKSLNNPAVQGIVAVTDTGQIETIRKHAAGVAGLSDKLKYWDYKEVLQVHEALESVNEAINSLGLVPQSF